MKHLRIGILCFLFLFLTIYILFFTYAFCNPLSLDEQRKNITIYDRYGAVLYESNFKNSHSWITYQQIPNLMKKSVLAVEDQHFFYHPGFDAPRLLKACCSNLIHHRIVQGGSTITQQFAKNLFLTNEQTITRKLHELFYSARLEMQYSKEDILEGYLNTCYYGHGIYGIQNAADYYFSKSLDQLSISQIAMLTAIPNGPSHFSPYLHLEQALARRNLVLSILLNKHIISNTQYKQARSESLHLAKHVEEQVDDNKQYYVDAILQNLKQLHLASYPNLHVYSYYDPHVQNTLSQAIHNNPFYDSELQVAAMITQPFTGAILALNGGKDYTSTQFNRALYSKRQIASTIKPLLYYCALTQGFTPSTTFVSQPTTFHLSEHETYSPTNYANLYAYDNISMIAALALSDNIYAMKTHLFLGKQTLANTLSSFGIDQVQANPSLALGTINLSLSSLSTIYNTFASEGLFIKPSFIDHVSTNKEDVYIRSKSCKRLLARDETLILNQLLQATYDLNTKSYTWPSMYGYAPSIPCAIKSGTSDWDSLVVGFNPEYTIAVWSGFDDNRPLESKYYCVSKQIFKDTFNSLYEHKQGIWYQPSNSIKAKTVEPLSGKQSRNGSIYWFKK